MDQSEEAGTKLSRFNFLQNSRVITKLLRVFSSNVKNKGGGKGEEGTKWSTSVHPASGCGWRSNHARAVLSRLDEHDERHRPSIQTIDIRPHDPLAGPWGCITRYTCCRFWLLSTDVTDLPRSPRDTNLSIHPPEKDEASISSPDVRRTN